MLIPDFTEKPEQVTHTLNELAIKIYLYLLK